MSAYSIRKQIYQDYLFEKHAETLAKKSKKDLYAVMDELLEVKEPTEAELKEFHQKSGMTQYPFEAIKEHLQRMAFQEKKHTKKSELVQKLEKKEKFKVMMEMPVAPVAQISLAAAHQKGEKDAPVTLVKFSDFYCGNCQSMSQTLKEILTTKKYKKKVNFVYMHFPVLGEKSEKAAMQSYCSQKQDKFWQFHDQVFDPAKKVDSEKVDQVMQNLALDTKKMATCLESKETKDFVSTSKAEAKKLGLTGTPTLFINGKKVMSAGSLAKTKEGITKALDEILKGSK